MKVTKVQPKNSKPYFATDALCPKCEFETFLRYSPSAETIFCEQCNYSEWRPLLESDQCVGFQNSAKLFPLSESAPKPNRSSLNATDDLIEQALSAIPFPVPYSDWLRVGFSLSSHYGARRAAELMWRYSPPTKPNETLADYERKFAKADGRVTIGTLFAIAKQYGFKFPSARKPAEPSASSAPLVKLPSVSGAAKPVETSIDAEPPEPSALELAASRRIEFSETLVPNGLIKRIYAHFRKADAPKEFAFASALATIASVVGNRVAIRFGDMRIAPNDFFILLAPSGTGKSSALEPCRALLSKLERRIIQSDAPQFVLPSAFSEAGLLALLRDPTTVERKLVADGKASPKAQTSSGLALNDEISGVFADMRRDFNRRLQSLLLRLWDGAPFSVATKGDGLWRVPETAVSILGASTQRLLSRELPETAYVDGTLARFNVVTTSRRTAPRTSIGRLALQTVFADESPRLIDDLVRFYDFVCKAEPPTLTPCAVNEDENATRDWFGEQQTLAESDALDGYYNRLPARLWKFAILVASTRAFEAGGAIVIDGDAIRQARAICDFFKNAVVRFVAQTERRADDNGIDAIGKAKMRLLDLLENKFGGRAKRKALRDYSRFGKTVFESALNELLEEGKATVESVPNENGVPVVYVVSPPTFEVKKPSSLSSLLHFNEKTETETQTKLGSEEKKVASVEVKKPVPEPPEPPETDGRPKTTFVAGVECLAEPLPEPFRDDPTPVENAPNRWEALKSALAEKQTFTGDELREIVKRHSVDGTEYDVHRRLLWVRRVVVKLGGERDVFVMNADEHRPPHLRGLVADENGVLPYDDFPF